MSLKDDLAAGRINLNNVIANPAPTTMGGVSSSSIADGKTIAPVLRTPEQQAKLDSKYGKVAQVVFAGKPMDQINIPLPPAGDAISPVDIQVGQPIVGKYNPDQLPSVSDRLEEIAGILIAYDKPIPDPQTRYTMVMNLLPVGASFPISEPSVKKNQISYWIKIICKGNEKKFTSAKEGEGWRVWRTA